MTYETISYELDAGVAKITLNRPDRLNAFSATMYDEMLDLFARITRDEAARAVLITGAGRAFSAGQDLLDREMVKVDDDADIGASLDRYNNPLVRALAELERPVVAAVNGIAAGAGVCIALACDLVLAARSARFMLSFSHVGIIPDTGGSWLLPQAMGTTRAIGAAMLGDPISASEAAAWGMIWKCVDDDALGSDAIALAQRLARGPTAGLVATKRALRGAPRKSLSEALDYERDTMRRLGQTHDYREGVAAFMNRRQPLFRGQ